MAERRMFAKSIIGSARFLMMPPTSRLLYYDLGMYADDDGVVEAFTVLRQTNANEDDLRILVAKGFVKVLNEELVSKITDWNTNNLIRNDRYHPSIYKDLLLQIESGIPVVNQRLTEVSIGKDSIGNNKPKTKRFKPPTVEEVREYCKERKNNINPEQFVDFYTANGWKVGKNSMKDWKASVRTWERNHKDDKPKQTDEIKPRRYKEFEKEEWERPDFKAEQMPDDIRAKLGKVGRKI